MSKQVKLPLLEKVGRVSVGCPDLTEAAALEERSLYPNFGVEQRRIHRLCPVGTKIGLPSLRQGILSLPERPGWAGGDIARCDLHL